MKTLVRSRRGAVIVLVALVVSCAGQAVAAPGAPTLEVMKKYQDQLLKAGEKERVLTEFKERVTKEETAINRYLLGRVYGKLADFAKARAEFDRALELDALCAPACQGLALCLIQAREFERAIAMLRRALTIDSKDDQSRLMLAELLAGTGDPAGAIKLLQDVLERAPDHLAARFLLGQTHFRSRQFLKARGEFKALLFHDKDHVPARKMLILCYMELKEFKSAESELRKLLEAAHKDQESRLMLVDVLLRMVRIPEAITLLKEALEIGLPEEVEKKVREKLEELEKVGAGAPVKRAYEALTKKLESEDPAVRRLAMKRLATLKFNRVPTVIQRGILDEDVGVRVLVARTLGETGDERDVPLLALKLRHPTDRDKNKYVRGACAEALGKMTSPAGVPVLLTVLGDEEPYVVELALASLRKRCGLRFSEGDAATAIEKDVAAVRQAWWKWWRSDKAVVWKLKAIVAVAKLDAMALVSYLIPLMEDASPEIFTAAYAAFTAVTKKSFGEVKDDPKDRARVAKLAREWWKAGGR